MIESSVTLLNCGQLAVRKSILKSIMSEIIYGIHSVKALLDNDPQRFLEVFILKGRDDKRLKPLIDELEASGIVIQVASRQWLDEKSEGAVHQGIIARVREGRQYQENDLPALLESLDCPFLLVLDGVTIHITWVPVCVPRMRRVFTR